MLHKVPMIMQDRFYVLPPACQFLFVVRVSVDTAVREHYIFADFCYLSIDLYLFLQLYHI